MQIAALYLSTAVVFLGLDAVMLRAFMAPMFRAQLGEAVLASPRLAPAAVFYLAYVAGLLWLVSLPALRDGDPGQALVRGAVLGAIAYGTYEFTSYAILRDWSPRLVAADVVWGTLLTGLSAWAGVVVARLLG